jgi:adenylate cyclase
MMVVLSPDCDLEQDFNLRFTRVMDDAKDEEWEADQHPGAVGHVLLCDLFSYAEIRPRFKGDKKLWARVPRNQDERYHHFDPAPVEGKQLVLHHLYIDFKRTVSISTERLYDGVLAGDTERLALVPPQYLHDLIHRFYGFLSRVALPD